MHRRSPHQWCNSSLVNVFSGPALTLKCITCKNIYFCCCNLAQGVCYCIRAWVVGAQEASSSDDSISVSGKKCNIKVLMMAKKKEGNYIKRNERSQKAQEKKDEKRVWERRACCEKWQSDTKSPFLCEDCKWREIYEKEEAQKENNGKTR